jgi:hypothetical protein
MAQQIIMKADGALTEAGAPRVVMSVMGGEVVLTLEMTARFEAVLKRARQHAEGLVAINSDPALSALLEMPVAGFA